jgi:hypothetical protein
MGLVHTANSIITDGLVFHIDSANYKSWTSNTKNLISLNPLPTSSIGYIAAGGIGDSPSYDISKQAVKWQRNSYEPWGAYFYIDRQFTGEFDLTKQYTASFEWYSESEYSVTTGTFNFEIVRGDGFGYVASAGVFGNSVAIGDGWYRFSYTFTPTNVGDTGLFRIITNDRGALRTNFWWRKLQLEQSATRTDFIDGTAPTLFNNLGTQGGTATIPSGITYVPKNGGASWFRGNAQMTGFTIPASIVNLETLAQSRNFTVMFGIHKKYYGYGGNSTGNSVMLTGSASGYSSGWRILEDSGGTPGNAFSGFHNFGLAYGGIGLGISIVDTVANRPAITAFSVGPTTLRAFLNGQFSSVSTPAYIPGDGHTGQICTSNYGVGAFGGEFYFMMIYNRALTSEEITQNYNALRGRYGL